MKTYIVTIETWHRFVKKEVTVVAINEEAAKFKAVEELGLGDIQYRVLTVEEVEINGTKSKQ